MPPKLAHRTGAIASALALVLFVSACGGAGKASTPASVTASATAGASSSEAAGSSAAATATPAAGGPANLDAASEVAAGAVFDVTWTGPDGDGDYITIVAAGATAWTNEPYFYTHNGSPYHLVAPIKDGAYALWYVSAAGDTDTILARRAIRVTPFVGALGGPAEVQAGSSFDVAWNGPDGPQDYVTIVPVGTTKWTDESYFYTRNHQPGTLVAPLEAGSYELWYVTGTDDSTQAKAPIKVNPYVVTLSAPAQVAKGAKFDVAWTGPNGPQDYITIVPAGSPPGTYLDYKYIQNGSPITLTAPATAGNYEIWYASDRVKNVIFKSIPIVVH